MKEAETGTLIEDRDRDKDPSAWLSPARPPSFASFCKFLRITRELPLPITLSYLNASAGQDAAAEVFVGEVGVSTPLREGGRQSAASRCRCMEHGL